MPRAVRRSRLPWNLSVHGSASGGATPHAFVLEDRLPGQRRGRGGPHLTLGTGIAWGRLILEATDAEAPRGAVSG
jgi:hypothetical protein